MVGNFGGNKTCYWSLEYFKNVMPIIWNQSKRKQDVASKCHIVKIVNSNQNLIINNSTSPIQSILKKQFSMQCQTVCSGMQVTVQIKGKWIQCLIYQPASWKRLSISLANSSRSERNSLQCSPQGRNQKQIVVPILTWTC